jgi:hypothetical protein
MIREENIRLIFGLKVRQARAEKELSQGDLAKVTGISPAYLNEIEKGKKYPRTDKIAVLAESLGVSYDWLTSLQLTPQLAPLAELFQTDLLHVLPLDMFGLDTESVLDFIVKAPVKVSALINTLVEMARLYDMKAESFYMAVLRSYQEIHGNYFPEIEQDVEEFRQAFGLGDALPTVEQLTYLLQEKFGYTIDENTLPTHTELQSLRSVMRAGKTPTLLLNPHTSPAQKRFTLGRELAYAYKKDWTPRPYTFSWIKVHSFEEVLHNFKASYFSSALLIPQERFRQDLSNFFEQKTWNPAYFLDLLERYQATPEMLMHRLTNIVPRFFNIPHLFFLRFYKEKGKDEFILNKELHLAGLYNPHGIMTNEHHCRRWVSLNILKELENTHVAGKLCKAQRSQYLDSENEYLCISLASPASPTPNTQVSLTIGFLMNNVFKEKVKFWQDLAVPVRKVGVACERCALQNCPERVAPAEGLESKRKAEAMQKAFEGLLNHLV